MEKLLTELSDQELLEKSKKIKSSNIVNAVLFGCMIGIAIYSTATNGLGFFTIFPLFFLPMVINNGKKNKEIEKEMKLRNLK